VKRARSDVDASGGKSSAASSMPSFSVNSQHAPAALHRAFVSSIGPRAKQRFPTLTIRGCHSMRRVKVPRLARWRTVDANRFGEVRTFRSPMNSCQGYPFSSTPPPPRRSARRRIAGRGRRVRPPTPVIKPASCPRPPPCTKTPCQANPQLRSAGRRDSVRAGSPSTRHARFVEGGVPHAPHSDARRNAVRSGRR
jgi:hypothetical protein